MVMEQPGVGNHQDEGIRISQIHPSHTLVDAWGAKINHKSSHLSTELATLADALFTHGAMLAC